MVNGMVEMKNSINTKIKRPAFNADLFLFH